MRSSHCLLHIFTTSTSEENHKEKKWRGKEKIASIHKKVFDSLNSFKLIAKE
jgi:hypothetical protein